MSIIKKITAALLRKEVDTVFSRNFWQTIYNDYLQSGLDEYNKETFICLASPLFARTWAIRDNKIRINKLAVQYLRRKNCSIFAGCALHKNRGILFNGYSRKIRVEFLEWVLSQFDEEEKRNKTP